MLIALVIIGGVIVVLLLYVALFRKPSNNSDAALLVKEDLNQLNQAVNLLKEGLQSQLTERLDKNERSMRDSMVKQFSASSRLISEVTEKLVKLDETNK